MAQKEKHEHKRAQKRAQTRRAPLRPASALSACPRSREAEVRQFVADKKAEDAARKNWQQKTVMLRPSDHPAAETSARFPAGTPIQDVLSAIGVDNADLADALTWANDAPSLDLGPIGIRLLSHASRSCK